MADTREAQIHQISRRVLYHSNDTAYNHARIALAAILFALLFGRVMLLLRSRNESRQAPEGYSPLQAIVVHQNDELSMIKGSPRAILLRQQLLGNLSTDLADLQGLAKEGGVVWKDVVAAATLDSDKEHVGHAGNPPASV